MKIFSAIASTFIKTKDNTSVEHLESNEYRNNLETLCDRYLVDDDTILEFECSEKALPYVVVILEEPNFLKRYEFQQVSDSLFQIRLRSLDL